MKEKTISHCFEESARLLLACTDTNIALLMRMAEELIFCFERGNKLMLCGNGGSAAQAQHFAAELINKLSVYRKALPAIALSTDTSVLTSIGNDLDFSEVFSRQIGALGIKDDVLWALSTSGTSVNIVKAVEKAREIGMVTFVFSGKDGGRAKKLADYCLVMPSQNAARIQEVHLCAGHAVCEMVESHFLSQQGGG